ncbi:hypothetical protein BJ170DRAFT_678933 [Xylariales sp. AK1849]|nr:hypothetical protein BJ170DRAFT_678933 [Xylariales sp. AK1849]
MLSRLYRKVMRMLQDSIGQDNPVVLVLSASLSKQLKTHIQPYIENPDRAGLIKPAITAQRHHSTAVGISRLQGIGLVYEILNALWTGKNDSGDVQHLAMILRAMSQEYLRGPGPAGRTRVARAVALGSGVIGKTYREAKGKDDRSRVSSLAYLNTAIKSLLREDGCEIPALHLSRYQCRWVDVYKKNGKSACLEEFRQLSEEAHCCKRKIVKAIQQAEIPSRAPCGRGKAEHMKRLRDENKRERKAFVCLLRLMISCEKFINIST